MSDVGVKQLILICKVTGLLSMGGTSFIIYEVLSDKTKLKKTYFRLLLGMSVIEFTDGFAYFLSSWCIPEGFLAAGNNATCAFQGFLVQTSIGSTLYNAFLALYYLLSIKYDWSERLIAKRVEPWMHSISLSLGYGTAIAAAALGLYVSYGDMCYIGKTPMDCLETYQHGYTTCTKGDNSSLYLIFFFTIWQWASVAFTAVSMILIWCHIRQHENTMFRYAFAERKTRKDSRRFAVQGALYVLVFYFSHFFATILIFYLLSGKHNPKVISGLRVMYGLTYPLEGFLNFLVYMRPRMIKKWEERENRKKSALTSRTDNWLSEGPRDARVTVPEAVGIDHTHGVSDTNRNENEADSNEFGYRGEVSESDCKRESSEGLTCQGRSDPGRNNQAENNQAENSQAENSQGGDGLGKDVEEIDEMQNVGEDPHVNTTSAMNAAHLPKPASL